MPPKRLKNRLQVVIAGGSYWGEFFRLLSQSHSCHQPTMCAFSLYSISLSCGLVTIKLTLRYIFILYIGSHSTEKFYNLRTLTIPNLLN